MAKKVVKIKITGNPNQLDEEVTIKIKPWLLDIRLIDHQNAEWKVNLPGNNPNVFVERITGIGRPLPDILPPNHPDAATDPENEARGPFTVAAQQVESYEIVLNLEGRIVKIDPDYRVRP